MAFTASKVNYHEEPIGAGFHGIMKVFCVALAAATPYTLYFDGFKLEDPDNVMVMFGNAFVNGATETVGGIVPDTTKAIAADGKSMVLTHGAGGDCTVAIIGKWVKL